MFLSKFVSGQLGVRKSGSGLLTSWLYVCVTRLGI